MLDKIKGVFIRETKEKQKMLENLEERLQITQKKFSSYDFDTIILERKEIEEKLTILKSNILKRVFQKRKLQTLENTYHKLSNQCIEELYMVLKEEQRLLADISSYFQENISFREEIRRIQNATSIEELGFTSNQRIEELQKYFHYEAKTTIQKVFRDVVLENPRTKEDIKKMMQTLFQTNSSAFVLEMKKITWEELEKQLKEIGIPLEKEKFLFLNSFLSRNNSVSFENIKITDELDAYYWNEVEKGMKYLKKYPNSSFMIPELMTLSILVSITKKNKGESL